MNATILRLSAQALFGRRRFLLLLVLPLVLIGLAVAVRALAGPGEGYDEIVVGLGMVVAVPLVALLATTAVLGPEIDDGSIVYLLAKPVSRHAIAASKYAIALLAALLFGAVPVLVMGLINDAAHPGVSWAWFVGAAVAAAAYSGLFLAFSVLTRHAVVIGLLYAFFWEGVVANLLEGVRWLSVAMWARQVAGSLDDRIAVGPGVGLIYALVASLVVVVGGVWFTGHRLRSFSLRGEM